MRDGALSLAYLSLSLSLSLSHSLYLSNSLYLSHSLSHFLSLPYRPYQELLTRPDELKAPPAGKSQESSF
ncbi:hypothetical protein E2C01_067641 [Portunus trituberculatus]|uniref:Uncharacterized protein n=1 Tax=Portunus trituberculatus TaxID=210409 RepID=A0A5B7HVL2_PORTR|nr:hypothetical protein [Portunus trituberculatus]